MSIRRPSVAWLAELTPLDPETGTRVTVNVGSAPSASFMGLNGVVWEPAMASRPTLTQEYFTPDFDGSALVGQGDMAVATKALAESAVAKRLIWRGAGAKIWRGSTADWAAMKLSFDGIVTSERIDPNSGIAQLGLEIDTRDGDLLTVTFAGTGGREAAAEHKGRLKPAGFGTWAANPPNIPVFLFDEINNTGIIEAYGNLTDIDALYENGASFGPKTGDHASYEALIAATLAPGSWATCLAEGMIRLGAPPKNGGVITCDAQFGYDRAGALIRRIAEHHSGWPSGKIDVAAFDALDAAVPRRIRWWTEGQRSRFEFMQAIANAANAQLLVTLTGMLTVTRPVASSPVLTLVRGGGVEPYVTDWSMQETDEPWWKIEATAAPVHRRHATNEIDYVAELIDRGDYDAAETYRQGHIVRFTDGARYLYVNATASAGHAPPDPTYWELYEASSGDLSAIIAELDKIGADDWLVPVEKQAVIDRYDDLWNEEYSPLIDRALQLGLTAQRTAFIDAFLALNTYLAGLGPTPWNDTGGATPIVRTTWRTTWNAVFEARATLLAAIDVAIKAIADAKTRNVPRGTYSDLVVYEAGDQVIFSGSTYQFINSTPTAGVSPPNGTFWILVSAAGSGPPGADGQPGVSAWLSNSNHTVATAADGTGGNYASAGGLFNVWKGSSNLVSSATFSVAAASPATAWITINAAGFYTVTDPGVDQATATLRATVAGVNYDLTYSFSKNRNGQSVRLTATAQGFTFVDGVASPGGQVITLTAVRQNVPAGTAVFTTVPVVTLTGTGDTRALTAANFGANRQVLIGVSIGGITDELVLLRLDQSTAQAGATVGAPPGTTVGNLTVEQAALGSDVEGVEPFSNYADTAALQRAWDIDNGGSGELAFVSDNSSAGGKHLLVGANNGNDNRSLLCTRYFPYDSNKLHFVEFEIDRVAIGASARYYLGLSCLNAAGAEVPSGSGSFHYIAAQNSALVAGRQVIRAYFTGYGSPFVNADNPDTPTPLELGTVRYAPIMLIHYPSDGNFGTVTGQTKIHAVRWGVANRGAPGETPLTAIARTTSIQFDANADGSVKAGQLPKSIIYDVLLGADDVKAAASIGSLTFSGCTAVISGKNVDITDIGSNSGFVQVVWTYGLQSRTVRTEFVKKSDAAAGSTAVSFVNSILTTDTAYAQIGSSLALNASASGKITARAVVQYGVIETTGTCTLQAKLQYRAAGTTTWIDFTTNTERTGTTAFYDATDFAYEPGDISIPATLQSGLTADGAYEVRLLVRRSAGIRFPAAQTNFCYAEKTP